MVLPGKFDSAVRVRLGEKGGIGVRVRSLPDLHMICESPSFQVNMTEPYKPPIGKTDSLVEVDRNFSYPETLSFQMPEPGKSDKAKPEKN